MGCCDDDEEDLLLRPLLVANDLIQEILVRLPIVSLLRFKSVSKFWATLIESPSFTHFHTTFNNNNNNSSPSSNKFGSFIFQCTADYFQRYRQSASIIMLSTSSNKVAKDNGHHVFKLDTNVDVDDDDQQLVFKLDNFGFPSCYNFSGLPSCYNFSEIERIFMVGSCNGLICLSDTYEKEDVSFWSPTTVVDVSLLNPATKQFRILPSAITITIDGVSGQLRPYHLVAFGFDAVTMDYKVVQLCVFQSVLRNCHCRVQVYSLSTDSWRIVEGINYLPGEPFQDRDSVLCLNGSCFFMSKFFLNSNNPNSSHVNDRFIISFDLTKEIIIPIQLPNHHQGQELYLCYLGEKLALFTAECFAKVDDYTSTCVSYEDFKSVVGNGCYYELFTIWVLDYEHGSISSVNKKSWRQLHWFRIKRIPGEWNKPRGISNDGEFALLETCMDDGMGNKKRMKLFNLVTYQLKKKFLSCDRVLSKANTYKPSLVSIRGGNGCSSGSGG